MFKTLIICVTLLLALMTGCGVNDAEEQFNQGLCYYKGEGVAQDHEEAVKWFRKAAEQGHANAINLLQILGR